MIATATATRQATAVFAFAAEVEAAGLTVSATPTYRGVREVWASLRGGVSIVVAFGPSGRMLRASAHVAGLREVTVRGAAAPAFMSAMLRCACPYCLSEWR